MAAHLETLRTDTDAPELIDLNALPSERWQAGRIDLQASLQEALDILNNSPAEALYVQRPNAPGIEHIYGVLTRQKIESSYQ